MKMPKHTSGFTLFEMSMVLVIIALIAGSIVVGNHLMIIARDHRVLKESELYKQAVLAFKSKYNQLPGDMVNPGQWWQNEPWSGNGNGNGLIVWSHEGPEAWRQLELSGLAATGEISIACTHSCPAQPGVNIPASTAVNNAGWTIGINSHSHLNVLMFGAGVGNSLAVNPILPPQEVYALDSKVDDGDPISGSLRARDTRGSPVCVLESNHDAYDLNQTAATCNFDIAIGL